MIDDLPLRPTSFDHLEPAWRRFSNTPLLARVVIRRVLGSSDPYEVLVAMSYDGKSGRSDLFTADTREYARGLGVAYSTARAELDRMVRVGLIKPLESEPGKARRYAIHCPAAWAVRNADRALEWVVPSRRGKKPATSTPADRSADSSAERSAGAEPPPLSKGQQGPADLCAGPPADLSALPLLTGQRAQGPSAPSSTADSRPIDLIDVIDSVDGSHWTGVQELPRGQAWQELTAAELADRLARRVIAKGVGAILPMNGEASRSLYESWLGRLWRKRVFEVAGVWPSLHRANESVVPSFDEQWMPISMSSLSGAETAGRGGWHSTLLELANGSRFGSIFTAAGSANDPLTRRVMLAIEYIRWLSIDEYETGRAGGKVSTAGKDGKELGWAIRARRELCNLVQCVSHLRPYKDGDVRAIKFGAYLERRSVEPTYVGAEEAVLQSMQRVLPVVAEVGSYLVSWEVRGGIRSARLEVTSTGSQTSKGTVGGTLWTTENPDVLKAVGKPSEFTPAQWAACNPRRLSDEEVTKIRFGRYAHDEQAAD